MSSSSPCTSDEMMTDKDHLRQQIISKAEDHIRSVLSGDSSGHDFDHINRVRALAVLIGKSEGANVYLCELGALLHDIADWKFHGGDEFAGGKAARNFLEGIGVNATDIEAIVHIVDNMSFKGAAVKSKISSLEGRCVQDADRLDAIGAIGIARCFAYGGHKGRPLYDPKQPPQVHSNFEDYKKSNSSSLNHFYEKLFFIKDLMLTDTGKKMAQERHQFMEDFAKRFLEEWNVKME